jgi:prephenate dehydratase
VCGSDVQYVAKGSIREVFGALDESVTLALVPLENSTYGSVVETYDTFRDPRMGSKVFVRSEHVLAIQHCLIALPGTRMEEITRIISHEQVRSASASARRIPSSPTKASLIGVGPMW